MESGPGGWSLGFSQVEVYWRGIRGLRWPQVLSMAVGIVQAFWCLVILLIHAGGKDIGSVRMDELITLMCADLERIPGFFRQVILIWSEMIPRVV